MQNSVKTQVYVSCFVYMNMCPGSAVLPLC